MENPTACKMRYVEPSKQDTRVETRDRSSTEESSIGLESQLKTVSNVNLYCLSLQNTDQI